MHKTTKKDFRLFVQQCRRWQEILGLKGWEIEFEHTKLEEQNMWAECTWITEARCAGIALNTEWDRPPNEKRLNRTALHEVCHVLFGRLRSLAEWRFVRIEELKEEVHAVIRTLENVLLG